MRDNLSSLPLAVALRERTAEAHKSAETSSFIDELLTGRACPSAWGVLAVQQWVIYKALEDTIASHYVDHPLLAPLHDQELLRVPAIEADLRTLFGTDVFVRMARGELAVLPATAGYAAALRESHTVEMMVAHHYVRYLGDLSGGQIIATMLKRHYNVPDAALHFYRFEGIPKYKRYKDDYREALNGLPTTDAQREKILAEAVRAFEFNEAVFADIGMARGSMHASAGVAA